MYSRVHVKFILTFLMVASASKAFCMHRYKVLEEEVHQGGGLVMVIPTADVSVGHSGCRSPDIASPGSVEVGFGSPKEEDQTLARVQQPDPGYLEIYGWTPYNTRQALEELAMLDGHTWQDVSIVGTYLDWALPFWGQMRNLHITIPAEGVWRMDGTPQGEEMASLMIRLPGSRKDRFEMPIHFRATEELLTALMRDRGVRSVYVADETQENLFGVPRFQSPRSPDKKIADSGRLFEYDLEKPTTARQWHCGPFCDLYHIATSVRGAIEKEEGGSMAALFKHAFATTDALKIRSGNRQAGVATQ